MNQNSLLLFEITDTIYIRLDFSNSLDLTKQIQTISYTQRHK